MSKSHQYAQFPKNFKISPSLPHPKRMRLKISPIPKLEPIPDFEFESFDYQDFQNINLLAILTEEIDTWFTEHGFKEEKTSKADLCNEYIFNKGEVSSVMHSANSSSKTIVNDIRLEEFARSVYQRIKELEGNVCEDDIEFLCAFTPEIIRGEFAKDM